MRPKAKLSLFIFKTLEKEKKNKIVDTAAARTELNSPYLLLVLFDPNYLSYSNYPVWML